LAVHEPSLGQRPSPTSQIQPQQLLHKTDVIAIMGTVKLNRGVFNADTRWTVGRYTSYFIRLFPDRPILPGFKRDCSLHAGRGQTKDASVIGE